MNRAEKRYQEKLAKRAAKNTKSSRPPFEQQMRAIRESIGLAIGHFTAGRLSDAEAVFREILLLDPKQPVALHLLGVIAHRMGDSRKAVDLIKQSLAIDPDDANTHNNYGNILRDLGALDQALASYRAALTINPDHADAYSNLGNMYKDQGMLSGALTCFRKALAIIPNHAEAHNNLGGVLESLGMLDEALASYRAALDINPQYVSAHSNVLLSSQYQPGMSQKALKDLHAEWDEKHGAAWKSEWKDHSNTLQTDRALRIGLVSPDLGRHPVGYFVVNLLEHKPRGRIEFICYSDRKPDPLTEQLEGLSDEWVDSRGLSDAALTQRIRSDRIDILIDLAGHTAKNRLLVFARKPAPVQVTWFGYPGSTGLSAIDYLIADSRHIPAGTESHYSEKIIRLPNGWSCYEPPSYAPPIGKLPFERNGFITFGCFNNPAKVNKDTLAVWVEILAAVPRSQLLLKYKGMDAEENRNRLVDQFSAHGIEGGRVILEGMSPHQELFARYNDVDIALDTFPYSGGVTTCEALWMGVPVITLPGETFASRHSLSHLMNVDAPELVARDRQDYVSKAVGLATDIPRLGVLRSGLREQMARSPLCDGETFATDFTAAMESVWREQCANS